MFVAVMRRLIGQGILFVAVTEVPTFKDYACDLEELGCICTETDY